MEVGQRPLVRTVDYYVVVLQAVFSERPHTSHWEGGSPSAEVGSGESHGEQLSSPEILAYNQEGQVVYLLEAPHIARDLLPTAPWATASASIALCALATP